MPVSGGQCQEEVNPIIFWAEIHVPGLSAVHILGVENKQADFLSHWQFISEMFRAVCQRKSTLDVDLLSSRFNTTEEVCVHDQGPTGDCNRCLGDALGSVLVEIHFFL